MEQRFAQFHPAVTFLFYIGALSLLMLMLHPLFLVCGFIVVLLISFIHGQIQGLKRWSILMISTVVFILILTPLFNERGRTVLFEIANHRITLEAITYGGMTAISIISVIALFVSYNEIMTPNKLLFLFSKILPQFAVLLMLTLRFIPLMRRRLAEISAVQSSKGLSVLHGRFKDKAKNGLLYVQVLLSYSLEEAIQTADSMKARGYGSGKRSTYEYFRLKNIDIVAMVFLVSIFITLVFLRIYSGYGFLTIYPRMESFQLSEIEFLCLAGYLLFFSFPLLVEGWGYIRWRLLN